MNPTPFTPRKNETVVLQIPHKAVQYFTALGLSIYKCSPCSKGSEVKAPDQQAGIFIEELYKVYRAVKKKDGSTGLWHCTTGYFVPDEDYRETEAAQEEIQGQPTGWMLCQELPLVISRHYAEELKLSEMANLFGYSDAYLS